MPEGEYRFAASNPDVYTEACGFGGRDAIQESGCIADNGSVVEGSPCSVSIKGVYRSGQPIEALENTLSAACEDTAFIFIERGFMTLPSTVQEYTNSTGTDILSRIEEIIFNDETGLTIELL